MQEYSAEQRCINPYYSIDPGFINDRKCLSTFGQTFIDMYNHYSNKDSNWQAKLQNNHLKVSLALKFCQINEVKSLGEVLFDPSEGLLFSSIEELEGNPEVYDKTRVKNRVLTSFEYDKEVYLEYGTEHFVADTGKAEQSDRSRVAIIGDVRRIGDNEIILYPMIMGGPTFDSIENKNIDIDLTWVSYEWYESFPEDIDEFSKAKDIADPTPEEWMNYMKHTSETEIKEKFCAILNEVPKKDWGGEQSDIFTASVHLAGERVPTAFLLKGPSQFREMTPEVLGKRGDQIYRLSSTPARLLVVQHCHIIGEAVRATLRAFAVTPHNPRRYCLIDGKDTYRILRAYERI